MTRRVPLAAAVAVLSLALAPSAHAKGITKVVVCGADGCSDVTSVARDEALVEMGAATGGPTAGGPGFVRVKATIGPRATEGVIVTQLYVPARGIVATREDGGGWVWTRPLPATAYVLRRATRGVPTIPARRLPSAALATSPPPRPQTPAPVEAAGAGGGGLPAWTWPLGGLVVLLGAWGARRHMRA